MTSPKHRRGFVTALCVAVSTALLGGCSSADNARRPDQPDVELHVRGTRTSGDAGEPVVFAGILTCRGDREVGRGMFTGRAAELCAHVRTTPGALTPAPTGRVCAQVYGGPQTAHITGRIGARAIDLTAGRTDACGIAQWRGLQWLLGAPRRS